MNEEKPKASEVHPRGDSDKVERYGWKMFNKPPRLLMINKHDLHVDPRYQRTDQISVERVAQIAREFNWPAFGALGVAERTDGRKFVFEGQHRLLAAMKRSDVHKVPCAIYQMPVVQEEAKSFIASNTARKPMSSYSKWKAAVMCKDETALFIKRLIEDADCIASPNGGPRHVRCFASLARIGATEDGREILRRVFPIVAAICRDTEIAERLLAGCCYIESRLPKGTSLSDPRWRMRLISVGRASLVEAMASAVGLLKKSGARVYAFGIREAINRKLRMKLKVNLGEQDGVVLLSEESA